MTAFNSIARAAGALLVVTALSVDDFSEGQTMMRVKDHGLELKEAAALRALNFATQELANVRLERYHAAYELAEIYAAGEEATEARLGAIAAAIEAATNEHCVQAGHDPLDNVAQLAQGLANQRRLLEQYEPACSLLVEFCRHGLGWNLTSHEEYMAALLERFRSLQATAGGAP